MFSAFKNVYSLMLSTCKGRNELSTLLAAAVLGVDESVLAVVCKRMQQLPTMLGPAVHRGKDTTHKTL